VSVKEVGCDGIGAPAAELGADAQDCGVGPFPFEGFGGLPDLLFCDAGTGHGVLRSLNRIIT